MIEVTPEQVAEWAESQFAGLEKPQLRAACLCLGISAPTAMGIDGLRNKLLSHYGMVADKPESKEVKRSSVRIPPNLRSLMKWQGRRYRIHAQPLGGEHGDRKYPVSWEGEAFFMDPTQEYQDVPAPVFEALKNAVKKDLNMRWDAQRQENVHSWSTSKRYPYEIHHTAERGGVTPGTEHLPIDLRDWYISDAKAHDFYANEDRESLERIWANLTDKARPNKEDKESRTLDYWRREILQLLGLTPEQLEQAA